MSASVKTLPPHHNHYRLHFNSIDLIDRLWNKIQNHHKIINWEAKFIISILQHAFINVYHISQVQSKTQPLEFYEQLAKIILDPAFNL